MHSDTVVLIKTIMRAVQYMHEVGIVHRGGLAVASHIGYLFTNHFVETQDLRPENILFRSNGDNTDLVISEFGDSRFIDEQKFVLLSETCGSCEVNLRMFSTPLHIPFLTESRTLVVHSA